MAAILLATLVMQSRGHLEQPSVHSAVVVVCVFDK